MWANVLNTLYNLFYWFCNIYFEKKDFETEYYPSLCLETLSAQLSWTVCKHLQLNRDWIFRLECFGFKVFFIFQDHFVICIICHWVIEIIWTLPIISHHYKRGSLTLKCDLDLWVQHLSILQNKTLCGSTIVWSFVEFLHS